MANQTSQGNQGQPQRNQPKPAGTSGRPGDDRTTPSGGHRRIPDDDEDEDSGLGNRTINR